MQATGQERKQQLVLKSRLLRARLQYHSGPLVHSLHAGESALRVLGRVRQHPEWLLGAALAIAVLRPHRISAWLRGTALGMRSWRRMLPLLMSLRAPVSEPADQASKHLSAALRDLSSAVLSSVPTSALTRVLQTIAQAALRR